MKHRYTAITLLLIGMYAVYAWQFGDWTPRIKGQVWNLSGSIYRLFLLSLILVAYRSTAMRFATLLMILFDLVIAGCTTGWLIYRWEIIPGQSCTERLSLPLGVLAVVLGLVLLLWITERTK